jgi:hypothetical protein
MLGTVRKLTNPEADLGPATQIHHSSLLLLSLFLQTWAAEVDHLIRSMGSKSNPPFSVLTSGDPLASRSNVYHRNFLC